MPSSELRRPSLKRRANTFVRLGRFPFQNRGPRLENPPRETLTFLWSSRNSQQSDPETLSRKSRCQTPRRRRVPWCFRARGHFQANHTTRDASLLPVRWPRWVFPSFSGSAAETGGLKEGWVNIIDD